MRFEILREEMVKEQLIRRGIKDENVLNAMKNVKRELFVPDTLKNSAYSDNPLPIGNGQTISQPYIVAKMTELLECEKEHTVFEIGTGSGYQTAVLSFIVKRVYSMERIRELKLKASETLKKHNIKNILLFAGDGTIGLSQYAPFDRIIVTAASPDIPKILIDQLKNNGIIIIPVGNINYQYLVKIKKINNEIYKETFDPCRFVPLIGKNGFHK